MEIEHAWESNSHAQESCSETEVFKLVRRESTPAASPVLVVWEHRVTYSGRWDHPHSTEGKLRQDRRPSIGYRGRGS